jgi:hypothetical protein
MRFAWFALLPLLAGCHSTPSDVHEGTISRITDKGKSASPPSPYLDTARAAAASARADTLLVVQAARPFKHLSADPDVFRLVLRGPSVLKGAATFTITDADGQVIFREMLSAADLEAAFANETQAAKTTPVQREAYVRRRMNEFFDQSRFTIPALAASAPYPTGPNVADHATCDDLRKRPDSVLFTYQAGKEGQRKIAWSPLKNQVVRL